MEGIASQAVGGSPNGAGAAAATVQLGRHSYDVVPQRKAYLMRQLPKVFSAEALTAEGTADNIINFIDEHAYKLLKCFIPNVMPEFEYSGFQTKKAWEADEYDPELDHSPTIPEVRRALMVCAEANGLDLVKHLKNFISPDFLRAYLTSNLADLLTNTSPTSSAPSTESPLTSTGTTPPTSTENEDLLFPGSSASSDSLKTDESST